MIPLIPTVVLALFSFLCSAFVILRIVVPILPPSPLSRRVAPAEFGLPNFRSLTAADKSHLWLASFDIVAIGLIVWQVFAEAAGGPAGAAIAQDPASAVRVWLAMTIRQTCLFAVAGLTLLHVRMGRSVSFGTKHWMIWAPTTVLAVTSTTIAGVLAGVGVHSFFAGILAYTTATALLSTAAFSGLFITLFVIKRNLASLHGEEDQWPETYMEKPRPSFATEEVDNMKDGASWITSTAGSHSRQGSGSAWSFSTHQTVSTAHGHPGRQQGQHSASVPGKSSFWFGAASTDALNVPPVPPLPNTYGPLSPTSASLTDADPFRRDTPSPGPQKDHQRERLLSQNSWLTSTSGSHPTASAWSFPVTEQDMETQLAAHNVSTTNVHTTLLPTSATAVSRPQTPAMSSAQVLGGYGFNDLEKSFHDEYEEARSNVDVSLFSLAGWLLLIWVPMGLSFPYVLTSLVGNTPSSTFSVIFALSMTMSSPIMALNLLCRSPLPIPTGLFENRSALPKALSRQTTRNGGSLPPHKLSHNYKSSTRTSMTVVEGRRSGDVWLANGDAVDGRNKIGRALEMLRPSPKLSVMPMVINDDEPTVDPPVSLRMDASMSSAQATPKSETSEQFGRIRKDSKASSHFSSADASMAYTSQIMIAQKHYSTVAKTLLIGSSPEKQAALAECEADDEVIDEIEQAITTGVRRVSGHLRARSTSSIEPSTPTRDGFSPSPPPCLPLPPTPPNVRAHRLNKHKKSHSSGFEFNAVDDIHEIDELTAGMLPILVPGLTVGKGMKIREGDWTVKGRKRGINGRKSPIAEFGGDFSSSPQFHSTPARSKEVLNNVRKPEPKKSHMSLPSLGLGKDGVHTLAAEIGKALDKATGPNDRSNRRATVFGADAVANYMPTATGGLQVVREEPRKAASDLSRALSTRSLGLRADVPHGIDSPARYSPFERPPPSAASTVTLFEMNKDINGFDYADFEKDLDASGPLAESTPHNTRAGHYTREEEVPPLPTNTISTTASTRMKKNKRRSSIVYIKSDENSPVASPPEASTGVNRMQSFVRAVRPLVGKKKQTSEAGSTGKKGLRPLSLLQNRDVNTTASDAATPVAPKQGVKPLSLGKKSRLLTPANGVKRSDTNKERAALRQSEAVPALQVRPPSHVEYPYAYRA
ncbi:hypothetical protein CYLTODRAFT_341250 [Cylindrobasidium torrendii FP15055 ss-10]|uniref:Uncharacterized protein n=1 Tax=Cylindrobasidium torrendii FP15055 ss-10 TaxID=1314674 RepID=A0A0D7BUJ9_9AGAR|nr:hypothetical protein CYLTODRAFT_341250 [Cylindrobasidium torrendii FP15055 ss-10]